MDQKKSSAVVVLSGGQDSTYCLAWAKLHYANVYALTFDYGQRHSREIEAAEDVALLLDVPHMIVKLGDKILAGSSPLVNRDEQLEQYASAEAMDAVIGNRVEKTFVPMRNALFLTIAMNRAAVIGDGCEVVTGVCQDDNANYPDCTEGFIFALELAFDRGLGRPLGSTTIVCPLMDVPKSQQVGEMFDMGAQAAALYAFTHTSYAGDYPPLDRNHSTVLREKAFSDAALPDPLILRASFIDRVMDFPSRLHNYKDETVNAELLDCIDKMSSRLKELRSA